MKIWFIKQCCQGMIEDEGLLQKRSIFQQLAFNPPHPGLVAAGCCSEEDSSKSKNMSSREERVNSEKSYRWKKRPYHGPTDEPLTLNLVFGLILEITHWLFEKSVELPDVLVNTWDDRHLILPNFDTILSFSGLRKSCKPRCSLQRGLGRVASFLQGDFQ